MNPFKKIGKALFGKPIRKVKQAAIVGFIVPVMLWADNAFELGLGAQVVNELGTGVAATILIWLPIVQAYFAKSSREDVANIPR